MKNQYLIEGSTTKLIITSPRFGVFTFLIDTEDLARVQDHKWCIFRCKQKTGFRIYAKATRGKNILLHRLLSGAAPNTIVNHLNGDSLDTRKENIIPGTYQDNNQGVLKPKTAGIIAGVSFTKHAKNKKWHSYIHKDGKQQSLGYFKTEFDAMVARRSAELEYYGKFL